MSKDSKGVGSSDGRFSFTTEQYNQLLALINSNSTQAGLSGQLVHTVQSAHFAGIAKNYDSWIIDSGASDHMTPFESNLSSKRCTKQPIVMPNGSIASASHIGQIDLGSDLELNKALCVPSFTHNLISVSKLTKKNNCAAIFFPKFCVFQDLSTKKTIGMGEERDGLYYFGEHGKSTCLPSRNQTLPLNVWH